MAASNTSVCLHFASSCSRVERNFACRSYENDCLCLSDAFVVRETYFHVGLLLVDLLLEVGDVRLQLLVAFEETSTELGGQSEI